MLDTSGVGLLADAVALAGDASRVITIADEAAAEHRVRFHRLAVILVKTRHYHDVF